MQDTVNIISVISNQESKQEYQELNWEGSFEDYLKLVLDNPRITRNAFQRIYDMILSYGVEEVVERKKKTIRYRFFRDENHKGRDAVYGIDQSLAHLVDIFKSASRNYGTEKRVILLHGPVGSAKSTIVRLLKKGLEEYSRTPSGAMYSFAWTNISGDANKETLVTNDELPCLMHEEPLHLILPEQREPVIDALMRNSRDPDYHIRVDGDLCPACRQVYRELIRKCEGVWFKVMEHVKVQKFVLSEKDRIGIGTFQPKDEKNQDSTELTGDINYRKIAIYGSDSDARAFNFDGEFNIANRGIIEFIEVLKLEVAFLYDLLGASQEHKIKAKKFPQTDIDEVIIGHTNEPEYRKLLKNEFMEALRDRTVKIDIPYITTLSDEVNVYQKDYNPERIRAKHIAPHTIEMAAMWAVLTRLEQPKKTNLTLLQKLKLYDGKTLPGFTEDSIKELQGEAVREGMDGISPRYIQDKMSNALVNDQFPGCVNAFMVLNELEGGLQQHSLIKSDEQRKSYQQLLAVVKQEYEHIVKNEVQRAISADEEAISRMFGNYLDNVKAYTQRERVKNKYTGQDEAPNERLMRSIEEKIDIPESRKDDFRREIMNYIGALALEGKQFNYRSNERLYKALELKLFEDRKDSIKLTSLVSNVVDKETQEKIDVVKSRLIKNCGYCEVCSTDVLNYVASIFARGDAKI
jgi:serine protein kinase